MRKSLLPSELIKKKQNIEDLRNLVPKDVKINHLDVYDILLGKYNPKKEEENEENKENVEETDEVLVIAWFSC